MSHFLYVFTEEDRDKLLSLNYRLIKTENGAYIFENEPDKQFCLNNVSAVQSDILTF